MENYKGQTVFSNLKEVISLCVERINNTEAVFEREVETPYNPKSKEISNFREWMWKFWNPSMPQSLSPLMMLIYIDEYESGDEQPSNLHECVVKKWLDKNKEKYNLRSYSI